MPLKINGSSSGYTEIKAADAAANNTLTLPSASGTIVAADSSGAAGVTTLNASGNITSGGTVVMSSSFLRNRIINGDMRVGQRGSTVFSSTNNLYGWVDRWLISISGTTVSALGYQASGLSNTTSGYALQVGNVTTTGSTTVAVSQRIEALNCRDLNSSSITVSGKVLQQTGSSQTLSLAVNKPNAADNYSAGQTGISSTSLTVPHNTWTPFTWTLTLGSTDASNGIAFIMSYNSLSAQPNTQFYFGDIQLEKGTVATPFETRPYGQELALCQRYYQRASYGFSGNVTSGAEYEANINLPVVPRANPTVTFLSANGVSQFVTTTPTYTVVLPYWIRAKKTAGGTASGGYFIEYAEFSAEL